MRQLCVEQRVLAQSIIQIEFWNLHKECLATHIEKFDELSVSDQSKYEAMAERGNHGREAVSEKTRSRRSD